MTDSKIIRTGIVQRTFNEDVDLNRAANVTAIENLAGDGADLVVLSELHDSLYFCQTEDVDNFDLATQLSGEFADIYGAAAADNSVVLVASAFERRAPGLYHNTAVVFDSDGSIAGTYRKMHIPDDPGFYEKFYFTPGDMGFNPIDTSLGRLGVLVCWDQWYPEAARLMAMRGAEMLIYPTAIGWNPDDPADEKARQREAWITVQRGHAVANVHGARDAKLPDHRRHRHRAHRERAPLVALPARPPHRRIRLSAQPIPRLTPQHYSKG